MSGNMNDDLLLCLKCRGTGHDTGHCPVLEWKPELDWFFSEERRSFNLSRTFTNTDDLCICSRCESLDLVRLLESNPPWTSQSELSKAFTDGNDLILSLGTAETVQFWLNCSVCCCLFAIVPNPTSLDQEILLLPDWTICRVSGELGIKMDSPSKRKYTNCLLSALKPSSISLDVPVVAHRGDALCLVEPDIGTERTLGGREIGVHEMKVDMILGWVESCLKRHDHSCLPVPTEELGEIRLIDVISRKVVKYPGPECEYIALSYVWGGVIQDHYRLGDTLNALPRTLEDSLSLTRKLGRRYIWVDSLCIDQSDDVDKANQIERMWSIYRGAWITVINLSGTSADAGLSRLGRKEHYPQLRCCIQGKTVVSLMPTLSQQIWATPWGQRAWTFQEGLLSPRCLYISDHQIYFDCSSMQCCESLDETRSWGHQLTPRDNPTNEGFVTWMLRQAGAGALRIPLDWPSRRLEHWGEKLNLYSYRAMTFPTDGLRAFDGVLKRLETIYKKGFFYGLPLEDLDWALLWRSQRPPTRREGFPTWSFAGWKGPLYYGRPIDVKKTRRTPTYLQISGCKSGRMQRIFAATCDTPSSNDHDDICILLHNDPIDTASRVDLPDSDFRLKQHPSAENAGCLFITAIFLSFKPDFSQPRRRIYQMGQYETFTFDMKGVSCMIRITSTDRHIPGQWHDDRWIVDELEHDWTFILVARDYAQGFILHHLMLLNIDEETGIAERATVLELVIPLDELDVLTEFHPTKRQIVLV